MLQVELAALDYRSSRLVRVLDAATGKRMGFGEDGATEVVSARLVHGMVIPLSLDTVWCALASCTTHAKPYM